MERKHESTVFTTVWPVTKIRGRCVYLGVFPGGLSKISTKFAIGFFRQRLMKLRSRLLFTECVPLFRNWEKKAHENLSWQHGAPRPNSLMR